MTVQIATKDSRAAVAGGLVERNRMNARLSQGPTTQAGKLKSRRNSLKHGLTADPTVGITESPKTFKRLLKSVELCLVPTNVIETQICQRIAVGMWRLQRSFRIESAFVSQGRDRATPFRREIQDWIERIYEFWREIVRWEIIENEAPQRGKKQKKGIPERNQIHCLDRFREEEIMRNGIAITAMMKMIDDHMRKLSADPRFFNAYDAEQLAWLLGDSDLRIPVKSNDVRSPDPEMGSTWAQCGIGEAMRRDPQDPISDDFVSLVHHRIRTLSAQRLICEFPFSAQEAENRRTTGMLPDESTLNRILRYEVHADRSVSRALDMLAKLRGGTIETIKARLSTIIPNGTAVEVASERTSWSPVPSVQ